MLNRVIITNYSKTSAYILSTHKNHCGWQSRSQQIVLPLELRIANSSFALELYFFIITISDMVYKCCNSQPGELKLIRTYVTTVLFSRKLFSDVSCRKIYFIASIKLNISSISKTLSL